MTEKATPAQDSIDKLTDYLILNPKDLDALIKLSQCLVDAKNFPEAEIYLQKIEQLTPDNAEIKFFLGHTCYNQGKWQAAMHWYYACLELNSTHQQAYKYLGLTLQQTGDIMAAIDNLNKALELSEETDDQIELHNTLGLIYLKQRELDDAIKQFNMLQRLDPSSNIAKINLCSVLIRKGNLTEAQAILDEIPNNPTINHLCVIQQSRILVASEQVDKAIAELQKSSKKNPQFAHALHAELAEIYYLLEQHEQAEKYYQLALKHTNDKTSILSRLSNIALQQDNLIAAKNYLGEILAIDPSNNDAYTQLAAVCLHEGNFDGVIDCAEIAISIDPNNPTPYMHAAEAYMAKYSRDGYDAKNKEKATALYLNALEIFPDAPNITYRLSSIRTSFANDLELKLLKTTLEPLFTAYDNLTDKLNDLLYFTAAEANALAIYCNNCINNLLWDKLKQAKPILDKVVNDQLAANNNTCVPVFAAHYLFPEPDFHLPLAKTFAQAFKSPKRYTAYHNRASNKLNIGYISPDFNGHVVGFLIDAMFSYHDRSKFNVYGYSLRKRYDEQRKIITDSCDYFKELTELSHKDAAEVIHNDQIDILVDLAGYTAGCHPEILSYQPAPMQAHFLGQTGTMGADFIQYHLATEIMVPQHQLPLYAEQIVYLPETPIAIKQHKLPDSMPTKASYGLPDTGIIFCCFNNNYRVDEEVFNCWMQLLHAVPNSVLWLSTKSAKNKKQLQQHAKERDVDPERLIFKPAGKLNDDWHHSLADLYLDTFTVAAGTATILSAWIGLPVIAIAGDTPQSRFGAGILQAAGSEETIATSKEHYYEIALDLASHPEKIARIKEKLLAYRLKSPLFDQKRYIRHLEQAYLLIADDYENGRKSKTIRVPL